MIIKKIKEILVRLILNDPGFILSDKNDADEEISSDNINETSHDKSVSTDKSSESDQTDQKNNNIYRFRPKNLRRDLGIIVFVLFLLYLTNNYLVELHHKKHIEYSISFSVIDSAVEESLLIVNINTAEIDDLILLPGIGQSKAKAIIEYRETNGGFKNIEDIKNVKGIGVKIYENLKNHITVE